MTISPVSVSASPAMSSERTNFNFALAAQKKDIPYFESLSRDAIPVGKGGHEIEVISASTIADALKDRFGGDSFTYSNLRDMLKAAGWQEDDIQSPDGELGVINKLQNQFGNDKTFSFKEAGEIFANRFATEFKGKGMTKTEAQVWGVAK